MFLVHSTNRPQSPVYLWISTLRDVRHCAGSIILFHLFKMKKEKHRKAVTCLSHALSHLAELSIDLRCSDNIIFIF